MKLSLKQSEKRICDAFQEFITNCKIKNLAPKTIIYYEEGYNAFTNFYEEKNNINTVTKPLINNYILHLRNNTDINNMSINTRLKSLRGFMYYAMKMEYLKKFDIELIKYEKKIKETYSDAELKILLKKPNLKKCLFVEYRTWVIENYLLGTGNRLSTIINIKIEDLDFENNFIAMKVTKNKKQQLIPMSMTLRKILMEYLQFRKGTEEDYLFCTRTGGKLNPGTLQHDISEYNRKRGINKTSIHLFRHTFAKKWILGGGDPFRLQKMLSHSSMDTTRIYVNMFSNDLQQDFNKFDPLEQLQTNKNTIKMR